VRIHTPKKVMRVDTPLGATFYS